MATVERKKLKKDEIFNSEWKDQNSTIVTNLIQFA